MPRKSGISAGSLDPTSDFATTLAQFINAHDTGLRHCRKSIMARSKRPKEFFELSFEPRVVSKSLEPGALPRVKLGDVVLERATIDLSADEWKCIQDEFQSWEFDAPDPPLTRASYEMCFGALK